MVERGDGGAIVNVSSISSQSTLKDHVVYCELVQALCGVIAVLLSQNIHVRIILLYYPRILIIIIITCWPAF